VILASQIPTSPKAALFTDNYLSVTTIPYITWLLLHDYSNVLGQEITQPVRWPLLCHRWANAVEQSAWTASATGHHLRRMQTIVKNVYVWLVGPRRPVPER